MDDQDSIFCRGCLCNNRKISLIHDSPQKDCFLQILKETGVSISSMNYVCLCWECEALMTRFIKFKQQVKKCSKILYSFSTEQNLNVSTQQLPSKLKIQKVLELCLHPNMEIKTENVDEIIKVDIPVAPEMMTTILKEEDNISIVSDNFDDDVALVEFKNKKRKKKAKECKRKKKKKAGEISKEVELSPEELLEERRLLLEREDYVNAMFRCEKCIVSFPNIDDLNDHIKIKHDVNKSKFVCNICECSFATEVSYNYHTNKHTRRYQCMACMEKFNSKRGVNKHYEITHCHGVDVNFEINGLDSREKETEVSQGINDSTKQDEVLFPCEFCKKSFRWKTSLRKHVETHRIQAGQKRKPYCEPCRLCFSTTSNLQKHVKTSSKHQIQLKLWKLKESLPEASDSAEKLAHIELIKQAVNKAKQQYVCSQCGKTFQWRGNLQRHLKSHRARASGELVCEPCNRTFSSIATYKQHMKISKKHVSENDFQYICNDCGKRFANKTRLKEHVDWEHLKNYVHTCKVCQKVFKSHTSLYLHNQVVHKKNSGEHLCDHCGKHFPNLAKLRSHMIGLHSGAAPYRCGRCPARFSWHSCLSRHMRRAHAVRRT